MNYFRPFPLYIKDCKLTLQIHDMREVNKSLVNGTKAGADPKSDSGELDLKHNHDENLQVQKQVQARYCYWNIPTVIVYKTSEISH